MPLHVQDPAGFLTLHRFILSASKAIGALSRTLVARIPIYTTRKSFLAFLGSPAYGGKGLEILG